MIAAGCDPKQIIVVRAVDAGSGKERMFDITRDLTKLGREIDKHDDVVAVIIDPITSYLGEKTDSHKNASVRAALEPLAKQAADKGITIC